ncbi:MAG TPA: ribonuclease HI [Fastidiosipila sp.]|nr:ribonuclease HI [Fastidiosipila sp.]
MSDSRKPLPLVNIHTDGACSGNPGPGGWAAILVFGDIEKELSGFEQHTTNNRMELMAAIRGLEALNRPCRVRLHSDSAYLVSAFNLGWIDNWQKNGWKNAAGNAVSNPDLWKRLLKAMEPHDVTLIKVKGHSDDEMNNRCDKMAVNEIKQNTNV